MKIIQEPPRETGVVEECDICVIGGSCTGVFAAVAAARLGFRVALVEQNGFFGGVATASLVNIWHARFDTEGKREIIGGLTSEVIERLQRRNAVVDHSRDNSDRGAVLNTAELKIELDEMVTAESVRPFLHARFVAPLFREGALEAVAIEDKSGRRAIRAKVFIDASGDGDLVARAGFDVSVGDDLQPPTMCALLAGIDDFEQANPGLGLAQAVFDPDSGDTLRRGFLWAARVAGIPSLRMVAGTRVHGANCSDADELTNAEIEGRSQVRRICDILRANYEGTGNLSAASLPSYIGIRETRKASCLFQLSEAEVLSGRRFPDAIANGSYRVDIHHSDKGGVTFRYLDGTEVYSEPGREAERGRWRPEQTENPTFYQVPYRCLVPRGSNNVLVAGRMIDTDRGAYGAVRVMVNCNQMGQAAGTAAALALENGVSVANVDTDALRASLTKQEAIVL